jgi:hypothetical protein
MKRLHASYSHLLSCWLHFQHRLNHRHGPVPRRPPRWLLPPPPRRVAWKERHSATSSIFLSVAKQFAFVYPMSTTQATHYQRSARRRRCRGGHDDRRSPCHLWRIDSSIDIPAGTIAISDPVPMPVARFADLGVSVYVPAQPNLALTYHQAAISTNYTAAGNQTAQFPLQNPSKITGIY